jgi:iron-sulfur cluster assembly accessory protein
MLLKTKVTLREPGEPLQGDERLVSLTPSSGIKCSQLMQSQPIGKYLRVAINGGGCNGLSYQLKFVDNAQSSDIQVMSNGIPLLVDTRSALYLRGTIIDYSDSLMGGGFKFSNPNAKASCSCGESFNV